MRVLPLPAGAPFRHYGSVIGRLLRGSVGMGAQKREKDPVSRIVTGLGGQAMAAVLTIVSLVAMVYGWVAHSPDAKNLLLGAETLLVVAVVGGYMWLHNAYIRLRRANSRQMSDPAYFELVRGPLERDLVSDYEDIADGLLWLYAAKVREVTEFLMITLAEAKASDRRVRAVDLTVDPGLLATRTNYLAVNRKFITAGGAIDRLFICWSKDLTDEGFAENFLALVAEHKKIGVRCGLAVRDPLTSDLAMDYIVFGTGAVLVEEEQGTEDYTRGRSQVRFKSTDRWIAKFESVWGVGGTPAAALRMQAYETTVRPMLNGAGWDGIRVKESLNDAD